LEKISIIFPHRSEEGIPLEYNKVPTFYLRAFFFRTGNKFCPFLARRKGHSHMPDNGHEDGCGGLVSGSCHGSILPQNRATATVENRHAYASDLRNEKPLPPQWAKTFAEVLIFA
jgi:hypothetical protein